MMDSMELYILILIYLASTSFKAARVQESKNFCKTYLTTFSIDLDGIGQTTETCWCDELHAHLSCLISGQGRETYLCDCLKKELYRWLVLRYNQLGMIIETIKLCILKSVWMIAHSRSHLCEKSKTYVPILC